MTYVIYRIHVLKNLLIMLTVHNDSYVYMKSLFMNDYKDVLNVF